MIRGVSSMSGGQAGGKVLNGCPSVRNFLGNGKQSSFWSRTRTISSQLSGGVTIDGKSLPQFSRGSPGSLVLQSMPEINGRLDRKSCMV